MTGFEKLFSLIRKNEKRTGSDYTATVTRVKDGTAYVQITGAEITDTPVSMSVDAKAGDQVRVRINNGKAWLTGNDTRPPTSNTEEQIKAANDVLDLRLKEVEAAMAAFNQQYSRSHIGMIIMSTTLATVDQVKAQYGGTTWIQHTGYMLYGASSGVVANSAVKTGGEATHVLTPAETALKNHSHSMNHGHGLNYNMWFYDSSKTVSANHATQWSPNLGTQVAINNYTGSTGGVTEANGSAHNNMPPYKNVYIWERTA